jgi:hypothetical protein
MIASKRFTGVMIISIFLISMFGFLSQMRFGTAAYDPTVNTRVLLLTNREPKTESPLAVTLGLDSRIIVDNFGIIDDTPGAIQLKNMSNYDVVVVDCYLPAVKADRQWLHDQILANDLGLLFFGGNYTMGLDELSDLVPAYFNINKNQLNSTVSGVLLGVTGQQSIFGDYLDYVYNNTKATEIMRDQIQVAVAKEESALPSDQQSIFSKNVAWQSCPLLRERVFTFSKKANTSTIVEVPNTGEPLVVIGNFSRLISTNATSQVMFISTGVGNITFYDGTPPVPTAKEMNTPFKLWPYFNYLMYMAVFSLNVHHQIPIQSYADWPYSPIPHQREASIWMTFVASLWIFNFVLFFSLGKKKKTKDTNAAVTLAAEQAEKAQHPESGSSTDKEVQTTKPSTNEDDFADGNRTHVEEVPMDESPKTEDEPPSEEPSTDDSVNNKTFF